MLSQDAATPLLVRSNDDEWYGAWRERELGRVLRAGVTYLDYTGAALYPESLVRRDAERLAGAVLGNPHSQSGPSLSSTHDVDQARQAILAFLNADPAAYTVVLTPNASGACRLVGESFPFGPGGALALSQDNHNSINGIREFAVRAGAPLRVLPLDPELRLVDPMAALGGPPNGPALLAFPAQSNFSGVRHGLDLIAAARAQGWRVLLDAAAYLSSSDLDLSVVQPDFVCLSIYKIAGYPTGIGALVARKDALAELRRPSFAGGTVAWVSVLHDRYRLTSGAEGFEDGTAPFLAAGALPAALAAVRAVDRGRLGQHLACLTSALLDGFADLRHANGQPRVRVHGPGSTSGRGPTIAFTLLDADGHGIPYWLVEEQARRAGIAIRGGCFCNPGCAERALGLDAEAAIPCLERMGGHFDPAMLSSCLGGQPVGALRASMGLGSVRADVERLLDFIDAPPGSVANAAWDTGR